VAGNVRLDATCLERVNEIEGVVALVRAQRRAFADGGAIHYGQCGFPFGGAVLLRHFRDRRLIGFAENLDHLFFGESGLAHGLLAAVGSHPLNFHLVRKSPGRSVALSRSYCRGDGYNFVAELHSA
jgi:hypothetical protein